VEHEKTAPVAKEVQEPLKKVYNAPQLTIFGVLEEVTLIAYVASYLGMKNLV